MQGSFDIYDGVLSVEGKTAYRGLPNFAYISPIFSQEFRERSSKLMKRHYVMPAPCLSRVALPGSSSYTNYYTNTGRVGEGHRGTPQREYRYLQDFLDSTELC